MNRLKYFWFRNFVKVKMDLLLGKGKLAFEQYLKFNTNISSNEILGTEKSDFVEDMYDFISDIINKKKSQSDEGFRK